MNILFLRGFNNYFNRVIKKYSTLDDYRNESSSYIDLANINFNPNDGVATELIVGNENQKENNVPLDWENIGTPDYCVCYEQDGNSSSIVSRWYVLESERTRTGQYRLALKRDVIAEHFDQIKTAPCFVEKGMVKSADDPLIFNNESMTYNQIKTGELLLKDESNVPWIVGYVPSDLGGSQTTAIYTVTGTFNSQGGISLYTTSTAPRGLDAAYIELSWVVGSDTHKVKASPITTESAAMFNGFQATYTPEYSASYGRLQFRASSGTGPSSANYTVTMYINQPIPVSGYVNKALSEEIVANAIPASELPWAFDPSSTYLGGVEKWIEHYPFYNVIDGGYYRNIVVDMETVVTDHTSSTWAIQATKRIQKGSKQTQGSNPQNTWRLYSYKSGSGDGDFTIYGNDAALLSVVGDYGAISTTQMMYNYLQTKASITIFNGDISVIPTYNNKYVLYNNKYYKLTVTNQQPYSNIYFNYSGDSYFPYFSTQLNKLQTYTGGGLRITNYSSSSASIDIQIYLYGYTVVAQEVSTNTTVTTYFPSDGVRPHLTDAPYDMFAIPYGIVNVEKNGSNLFEVQKDASMFIASSIATTIGSQKVYDIQLVPYCPFRQFIDLEDGTIDLTGYDENKSYSIVKEVTTAGVSTPTSVILWGSRSNVSFDLAYTVNMPVYDDNAIINKKIVNETTMYRLSSPNYSGQFEFSVAKNNGVLHFNVDLTYRPFNPYIHVNPDFKGIYGQDWDDARGLICGGDFSFPILTSAWADYQVSNKNYQEIFDRQIQNMDINNQIASEQANWQKAAGVFGGIFGGGTGGALAGFKMGGGVGAAVGGALGAAVGGTLNWIGGSKDEEWLRRQQNEAKAYAIDMYGYQLGNIQAMPYSLTKTSALTYNNKLFPILETYESTAKEREILKNKIMYDGMTIMAIGQITDYITTTADLSFIRGDLIRIQNLDDDFHIADAIYQEIKKGVYLTSGLED